MSLIVIPLVLLPGIVTGLIAAWIAKRRGWAMFANIFWGMASSCIALLLVMIFMFDGWAALVLIIAAPLVTVLLLELIRQPPDDEENMKK